MLAAVRYQKAGRLEGDVHSVEHLVWLDFESGTRVAVGYGDELGTHHGFSITLRERRVIDGAYGPVLDVSTTPRVAPLIGKKVARASLAWDDVFDRLRHSLSIGVAIHADYLRRRDYPSALVLDFGDAGSMFVVVARLRPDGTAKAFVNELCVVFSRDRVAALGLRA